MKVQRDHQRDLDTLLERLKKVHGAAAVAQAALAAGIFIPADHDPSVPPLYTAAPDPITANGAP